MRTNKNAGFFPGAQGLILEEPLIFELSVPGRTGYSIPEDDLPDLPESVMPSGNLMRDDIPGMPEVSEVDIVRHYTRLSTWNYSIDHGFYPLGSCTMKYNPKVNDRTVSLPGFANLHPLVPPKHAQGALRLMHELGEYLKEISGLDAITLQPSAGAQGELTGMLMIKAYHESRGDRDRSIVLIPDSAHGTNPASCTVAGFTTKTLTSGNDGCIDLEELQSQLNDHVAAIMLTNPNTLGIFEKNACRIARMVHDAGGLIYMDGANLNALMGIVKPGQLGADILHINLHKTFSTPHGGGGPGSGPVAVNAALEPFLPIPRVIRTDDTFAWDYDKPMSIGQMHNFYGNFGVLVRAYTYIRSMGAAGLREAAETAVINANYIRVKLREHYQIAYDRICMHECIFNDLNQQKFGVSTLDIAKRLMDYGFHPPTIYFPLIVKGALMIEPTETESIETIDQFIRAMIEIDRETKSQPDLLHQAPIRTKRKRLDETLAARNPILRWTPDLNFPSQPD
ncbi:aminomethyl-transferring glycine dehydrogenase subunit GcvPB [bacterium]|nr:aminomethyl-transferring glycine dehydrogenase subunit GcvPB [candidate division CSSED10-310 bacterium]